MNKTQRQGRQAPRLWLWALVAIGGFTVGANLVARIDGGNGKKGFATGALFGTTVVGAIALIDGTQTTKSHRAEMRTLQLRLNHFSAELTQLKRTNGQLEQREKQLKTELAEASARAQESKQAFSQLKQRAGFSEVALTAAKTTEKNLILKLRQVEGQLRTLQSAAATRQQYDFAQGKAEGQKIAARQVTAITAQKDREIQAVELQAAELQTALDEAKAEIEAWETEFEGQLQRLGEAQEQEIYAKVVAQVKADYQARLTKVSNVIPQAIDKRCQRLRATWLAELKGQLDTVTAERDRALQQVEHYKEEFVGITADLESNLGDSELHQALQAQVEVLQGAVEQKDRAIQDYRAAIADLEAPRLFPGGYTNHRGNILIRHAHKQGVILDAIHRSRNTEAGHEVYYFAARKPEPPRDTLGKLNGDSLRLQHELDCKKLIQFSYDSDKLLYFAEVQLFTKRLSRDEIDRKWLKASKFKALVKDVCAFRVSANKGGSKSPTVRNLLGAKLLEGEKFKIRRYDPSAGSRKDYWRVAPTWRSYHEAIKMAAEIEALILRRQREKTARNGAEFDWVYYVIDELDNTISTLSGEVVHEGEDEISAAKVVMDAIAKAVKEGEHLQLGIIICTQTPNVRQLMKSEVIDKAFFNNLAQIVVEANVFDYLSSSTDQTKSPRLASDYRAVYDWCDKENDAISDEARKYRPALFVSKAKREIIELPPLGDYGFDKLDPTQPYDFKDFNAYEYAGARSLDQARLMASKAQVERVSGFHQAPNSPPEHPQNAAKLGADSSGFQSQPNGGNVAVAVDPKVLAKTDGVPNCPICGDALKPNGRGRGTYSGMKQFACRNQQHTSQMGGKTFYQ